MLKIGRIPAALFFAANFFALAAGANPQNAHSPMAPFVDSAQILKAGSKIREESARDALSSGLPSLAQLIIEDGEKDGGCLDAAGASFMGTYHWECNTSYASRKCKC